MGLHHSHDHSHGKEHGHGHHHHVHHEHDHDVNSPRNLDSRRRLKKVIVITLIFMLVEILTGYWANSLALISDAGHMMTDASALFFSFMVFIWSAKPANQKFTYGYHRLEILGAFFNGLFLIGLAIYIAIDAIQRIAHPEPVHALQVLIVSVLGLLVNLLAAWILMRGDKSNLNMRGALLHVAGDAFSSFGAIVAAAIILYNNWYAADAVAALITSLVIFFFSARLVFESSHYFLQGVPKDIQLDHLQKHILNITGVKEVKDLHVWALSSQERVCQLKLRLQNETINASEIKKSIRSMLLNHFGICNCTIEILDAADD